MGEENLASVEGELRRTPFAHLLVYALDRRLGGVLSLKDPSGAEHSVRFCDGVPVRVSTGDRYSLLGEMLVDAGAITRATLFKALTAKGRIGDVLVLAGRIDRALLETVAGDQFVRRITRLFTLPPETRYRYTERSSALSDEGESFSMDPLALLWAGLRDHGDASTLMDGALSKLGATPIKIHPEAALERFAFIEEEQLLVDHLSACSSTLASLCDFDLLPSPVVRCLVYLLLITRQIDFGTDALPIGAAPKSSARQPPESRVVAKMRLQPTFHRIGAAAPDMPGDGERGPNSARRSTGTHRAAGDEAISDRRKTGTHPAAGDEASSERRTTGTDGATSPKGEGSNPGTRRGPT